MLDEYSTRNDSLYYESFVRAESIHKRKSQFSSHSIYSDRDYEDMRGMEDSGEYDYPHRGE